MQLSLVVLAVLSRVLVAAGASVSGVVDSPVTVTVTRTFVTCPAEPCHTTTTIVASSSMILSTVDTTSARLTTLTNSASSTTIAITTSSTSAISVSTPSTTTSSITPSIVSPGRSFTPSATIVLADINVDPQIIVKRDPLADVDVPVTVYIDASTNPNAAVLTTDPLLATSFVIDATGTLSTTLHSYPYQCGGSDFQNTPGRFYCDDSGAIPQTFRGWVNSPTFTYQNWIFCYTSSNLALYMSDSGPTADCRRVTFTIDGSTADGST